MVKPVAESGGYGLIIGPHATSAQLDGFSRPAEGRSRQLHQSADAETVGVADIVRQRRAAAPHRSAAVRGDRQAIPGCCPAA